MKKRIVISMILASVIIFAACPPQYMAGSPDKTIAKGNWVLKIWITAKGTRSEGRVSHLYHKGQEVCPSGSHTSIATSLGQLEYIDAPYPWGWHGWEPVDTAGK